jgi:hypothetical protein
VNFDEAKEDLLQAAKRLERAYDSEPHGTSEWEIEYSTELLALAARELTRATEALPRDKRPVGWNTKPEEGRLAISLSQEDLNYLLQALQEARSGLAPAEPEERKTQGDLIRRLEQELWAFERHATKEAK